MGVGGARKGGKAWRGAAGRRTGSDSHAGDAGAATRTGDAAAGMEAPAAAWRWDRDGGAALGRRSELRLSGGDWVRAAARPAACLATCLRGGGFGARLLRILRGAGREEHQCTARGGELP
ncbi:hypothetical protein TSOC_005571 [Tetrabaena socialis]|uniref:Uncharacterized protein n=1 Tax=Tetrabaena socialis TaxID=47790 RepID=A0A2J8A5X1_9CHLO|nr:hypothetical protein TSOC_005571 [Tetrabaena socialis]|eukprot:PNH07926.1 hypothetical protein TSOC_005571 [Tetrabaena socialis]